MLHTRPGATPVSLCTPDMTPFAVGFSMDTAEAAVYQLRQRFRRLRIVCGVLIEQHCLRAGMHLEFPTSLVEIVAHGFRFRIKSLGSLSGFDETTAFVRFR
jgi:hypothetical protein